MEELIKTLLTEMGKPIQDTGYPFIVTSCLNPEHNDKHPSFSINLETGFGKCFSCGFKVTLDYWTNGRLDQEQIEEIERKAKMNRLKKTLQKPTQEVGNVYFPPRCCDVEEGWRGLKKETLQELGIYKCDTGIYADRVVFPMPDHTGEFKYFNTRALNNDIKPKYKYNKGININDVVYPYLQTPTNYIVLVEGIMDAISMYQDGIPAMCNFGVSNTMSANKIGYLMKLGVETIYLALDNDEAGQIGIAEYLESDLGDYFNLKLAKDCERLDEFNKSDAKDYNDFIQMRGQSSHQS